MGVAAHRLSTRARQAVALVAEEDGAGDHGGDRLVRTPIEAVGARDCAVSPSRSACVTDLPRCSLSSRASVRADA